MQIQGLSWYPGHMTKTKRMIVAEMGHMDAVCEILDARIPLSSATAKRSARMFWITVFPIVNLMVNHQASRKSLSLKSFM